MTYSQEIDYFQFSQNHFKGKDIYDKTQERLLAKSEAWVLIKTCWKEVLDGIHQRFEVRQKSTFEDGKWKGTYLRGVKRKHKEYNDRNKGTTTQDTSCQENT